MKSLKNIFKLLSSVLVVGLLLYSCNQQNTKDTVNSQSTGLSGPYLGQKSPGTTPEIFASGIISTDLDERDLTMTLDGKEIYFSVLSKKFNRRVSNIVCVKQINGVWSKPEMASFSGQFLGDIEPFIQADGKRLYFVSERPLVEGEDNKYRHNIWYVNKTENGWSKPIPIGEPINGQGAVYYPALTKSGTMYFSRVNEDKSELVYRSKFVDGSFAEPELQDLHVNNASNAFISPDEDFLIVPTVVVNNTVGNDDYYVSFRDENDNWSELINLGNTINTPGWDFCPSLSPDGKYFFFQRDAWTEDLNGKTLNYDDLVNIYNGRGDIYWVEASVITDLNPFK